MVDAYKHQEVVARAVFKMRARELPVSLDLVGPTFSPRRKRELNLLLPILKNLDPESRYMHYRGGVPFEDLTRIYRDTDVFAFASTCENMPNTLVEAMASGLPIACSNFGPMPEILGTAGVYFNPESVDSVDEALTRLVSDPALRKSVAEGAYQKASEYSWVRCSASTFQFLAEVAAASGIAV